VTDAGTTPVDPRNPWFPFSSGQGFSLMGKPWLDMPRPSKMAPCRCGGSGGKSAPLHDEPIIRMRLGEVCDLLARTNLPVTSVALESGFYDHSDFARQFRRQMGQTASQYRLERGSSVPLPPLE
jgi:hypothetical protein